MARDYIRYDKASLEQLVLECASFAEMLRRLGKQPVGGNVTNMKRMCASWDIDVSHMTGQAHARGKVSNRRVAAADRLVEGTERDHRTGAAKLRRSLDEIGRKRECVECGLTDSWNGKSIMLEVDHIDGRYWNNTPENLQYLCPNCHSQKTV